jgi:hypothetical protein
MYFRQYLRGKGSAFVYISVHGVQITTRELCDENWCGMLCITYKIHTPEFTFSWHFVNTFQFRLKSGNNYGHFTGRRTCVFAHFIRVTTVSNVSFRGKWNVLLSNTLFYYVLRFSRYLNKTRGMHVLYWRQRCDFVGSYCVYEKICRFKGSVHQTQFYLQLICISCILERLHKPKCRRKFRTVLAYNCEFTHLIAWLPASLKFPVGLWFVSVSLN